MLFWSFILAFVVGILYYVSPTYNVVQVEQKPQADALVATFVSAHQAAKRMMYSDVAGKKEVNKQCDSTNAEGKPIKVDCKDKDGNPILIEVEDTSKRMITFTYKTAVKNLGAACSAEGNIKGSGIFETSCETPSSSGTETPVYSVGNLVYIKTDELKNALPSSHKKVTSQFENEPVTSVIACISNKGTNSMGNEVTTEPYLTFDCKGGKSGGVGDYIITYMQAPDSEKSKVARNELWRSGILRRTKGSHECGVLSLIDDKDNRKRQKYDENAEYVLDNSRRFTVSVPKAITDVLRKDAVLKNDMDSGYLLFCITPIDDIRASFEWKCTHGYGKYKIMDGDTVVKDCATGE